MTLEGDFETQKQHKCWTGQKKQFVALKGKSQNKLSKLSNVDKKIVDGKVADFVFCQEWG